MSQFYANTNGGVMADNTFTNCNVAAAGGGGNGACQATGECYHGAGPYTVPWQLDGKQRWDQPRKHAAPTDGDAGACQAIGRGGYGGNVSWVRWAVVRRNTISGISAASLAANATSPVCGNVGVRGGDNGKMASTDVIAEHNLLSCLAPRVPLWGAGGNVYDCTHCVTRP